MRKVLINWRYYILTLLVCIGALGICAIPADTLPIGQWITLLITTKAIGAAAFYSCWRLTSIWEKKRLIPELSDIKEVE
ncbi:MAG: hypothetical protein ACI358_06650 [Candidatus Limimorpha sp.]